MLTKEERDIVVEAMRKYPAGISGASWGSSAKFFHNGYPIEYGYDIELLTNTTLLDGG